MCWRHRGYWGHDKSTLSARNSAGDDGIETRQHGWIVGIEAQVVQLSRPDGGIDGHALGLPPKKLVLDILRRTLRLATARLPMPLIRQASPTIRKAMR